MGMMMRLLFSWLSHVVFTKEKFDVTILVPSKNSSTSTKKNFGKDMITWKMDTKEKFS